MKKMCAASILILAGCVASFAQTNQTTPCPTISVNGPWNSVKFGETATFAANVGKEAEKYQISYLWTLSTGKILEGQGTSTIKIVETEFGRSAMATVEILGLPKDCINSASETLAPYDVPSLRQISEFSISVNRIDKARLDILANELLNNPIAEIYIIERFERRTARKTIKQKNQKTVDYLKTRSVADERVVILNAKADKNQTEFYIVPTGAEPPNCDECTKIEIK